VLSCTIHAIIREKATARGRAGTSPVSAGLPATHINPSRLKAGLNE
jgi:hypothetical protein